MKKLRQGIYHLYRLLFAKRFFYKFNRFLHACSLKGLGVTNFGPKCSGEIHFVKSHLRGKNRPVIFDVGAHKGEWSHEVLQANPSSQIFAFEPHASLIGQIEKLSGVKVYNVACGSSNKTAFLYDRKDQLNSTHASLTASVISECHHQKVSQEEVEVISLDTFIQNQELPCIDLLKIDVEGHEYDVLQGCRRALDRGVIQAIAFEFNAMNVASRRFFADFEKLLPEFTFYRLLPKGKIPLRHYDPLLHELFGYQNIVAIKKA